MVSLSPGGVVVEERGVSDVTSLRIVTRVSQGPTTQGIWSLSPGGVVVERLSVGPQMSHHSGFRL